MEFSVEIYIFYDFSAWWYVACDDGTCISLSLYLSTNRKKEPVRNPDVLDDYSIRAQIVVYIHTYRATD